MDQSQSVLKRLKNEDSPMMNTIRGASMGLAAGTIYGAVVAPRNDVSPQLSRTLRVCGKYGVTLAALGFIYAGTEQLLEKNRTKKDLVNGTVAGFVAGAAVMGFKGRSFSTGLSSGFALALTSATLQSIDRMTR